MCRLVDMLDAVDGCKVDFISRLQSRDEGGRPSGWLNGVAFVITYKRGEYLLLTVVCRDEEWEKVLETLRGVCGEFMGEAAICHYRESEPLRITVEWDLVNPEGHLDEIVNGGGVFAKRKIEDLTLLGGREIAKYENEEAKQKFVEAEAERVKNARIYGIDPGSRDVEWVKSAAEWELFLEYYSVTKVAWRMNHDGSRDHSRGYITDEAWKSMRKDLAELQYDIEYLVYAISRKIGIEVPEPEVDKHVSPDGEMFMKWYRFYNNHFNNSLSDEQWNAFEAKRRNGEDVSNYLPSGDWHESAT